MGWLNNKASTYVSGLATPTTVVVDRPNLRALLTPPDQPAGHERHGVSHRARHERHPATAGPPRIDDRQQAFDITPRYFPDIDPLARAPWLSTSCYSTEPFVRGVTVRYRALPPPTPRPLVADLCTAGAAMRCPGYRRGVMRVGGTACRDRCPPISGTIERTCCGPSPREPTGRFPRRGTVGAWCALPPKVLQCACRLACLHRSGD